MALLRFHVLLVACGILFCLGFAGLEAVQYRESGDRTKLWLALFFAAAGLALGGYLDWFIRKRLRR